MLLFQTKREVPVTCTLYCSGWTRRTDQRTRPKNCGLPAARSNHPFTTSFKKRNAVCLCGMTPWPTNPWIQNKTQWFEMTPPPPTFYIFSPCLNQQHFVVMQGDPLQPQNLLLQSAVYIAVWVDPLHHPSQFMWDFLPCVTPVLQRDLEAKMAEQLTAKPNLCLAGYLANLAGFQFCTFLTLWR